jgi:hypothetical protein
VQYQRRGIAIHFHVENIDPFLDFYTKHLPFEILANHIIVGSGRKLVVKFSYSSDIQLNFHEAGNPGTMDAPIKLQFAHKDHQKLKQDLKSAGIEFTEYDWPWTWGIKVIDPFGNELDFTRGYDER